MKKVIGAILCILLFLNLCSFSKSYQTPHFRIYSDFDPKYLYFIKNNIEAYYEGMLPGYFSKGFEKPLVIYYSKTLSGSKKLLRRAGFMDDVSYGIYEKTIPAVYAHRDMEDGSISGWGTLFHEITHHFIHINYGECPTWFNEGLACFLGEESRVVKGQLQIGYPNPWREQILRDSIENGAIIDVKKLVSLSYSEFHEWHLGYHVARALFYWLHKIGQLNNYLKSVQQGGYSIEVLEKLLSISHEEINNQFLSFIKNNCYAGAYLKDARDAKDPIKIKKAYLKALEIKPDYQQAQLELAYLFRENHEYKMCKKYLISVLKDTKSKCYLDAAICMGEIYFLEKNYQKALEYFMKAWGHSDHHEYKCSVAFFIASCYLCLGDMNNAKKYFSYYLEYNWEPDLHPEMIEFAKKYI